MKEYRNVPFRDWSIRVSRSHNGQVHICASDVCEVLKRDELIKKGTITEICPSALRLPFRANGRELWGFRPADMRRLLQLVRKDSILPRNLIDELEVWGNQLLELEAGDMHAHGQRDFVLSYEADFPVTFRKMGNKLMVNATQITMHFGKIPSEWLRITATDSLRREMARSGQTDRYEFQIFTTRGRGKGATWIESPLVVPLARWIAPDSGLADWCAQQIERLTADIAPRPVRRREYKSLEIRCLDQPLPTDMDTALAMIEEHRKVIRDFIPKVAFYDDFIENREWFRSTRIADELNISPRSLHQFLLEQGICKYQKHQWLVFRRTGHGSVTFPIPGRTRRGKYLPSAQPNGGHRWDANVSLSCGKEYTLNTSDYGESLTTHHPQDRAQASFL